MSRIALYTATLGSYESPFDVIPASMGAGEEVDYYRFIDSSENGGNTIDRSRERGWHYVRHTPRVPGDPIRDARSVKILGHRLISTYDVTVWIDNRVRLKIGVEELVDRFLPDGADIAVPIHSYRESLSDEFDAVLDGRFDDPRRIREQRSAYSRLAPEILKAPVNWTAILIRRNNDKVHRFNTIWWEQVLRFSRRDQLSFPYACHVSSDLATCPFGLDNFESDIHEWRGVLDVGRAPGAGLWTPPSLRADLHDLVKFAKQKQRNKFRDAMPDVVARGARRFRDRAREIRAKR